MRRLHIYHSLRSINNHLHTMCTAESLQRDRASLNSLQCADRDRKYSHYIHHCTKSNVQIHHKMVCILHFHPIHIHQCIPYIHSSSKQDTLSMYIDHIRSSQQRDYCIHKNCSHLCDSFDSMRYRHIPGGQSLRESRSDNQYVLNSHVVENQQMTKCKLVKSS